MTNNSDMNSRRGCIELVSLGVFVFGAAMMFPKTVDLLINYAPNEIMGYTDVAGWWAAGSALMIEGMLVTFKIKMWLWPGKNLLEWVTDIILTVVPFGLSAMAQVFDSMINQNTLSQQPAEIQFIATWGVPLLPAAMILLLLVYSWVSTAPNDLFGGMFSGESVTFKLPKFKLPSFKKSSNGRKPVPEANPTKASPTNRS